MNKLKKEQKAKVGEFRTFAGARISNANAIEFLKAENWDLERAVNRYFNAGAEAGAPIDDDSGAAAGTSGPDALFDRFKSKEDADIMDVDGIMELMQEVGMSETDNALIVFAYHAGASNFSEYTREEFTAACEELDITDVASFKKKLPSLRKQLDDNAKFEQIYYFTFPYACDPGKKIMGLEGAIGLWKQLFVGKQAWPYTEAWCTFLEEKHGRPMQLDTWRLLLPFKRANHSSFDSFDDTQAWPTLIDEFVEWQQEKDEAAMS